MSLSQNKNIGQEKNNVNFFKRNNRFQFGRAIDFDEDKYK
jgi:hypothetical protein